MKAKPVTAAIMALALLVAACGGGASPTSTSAGTTTTATTTTGTTTSSATCSLRSRQDWAAAQLREWYLFPETLPASLDPTPYATVSDYVDALTATARSQGRDRYFTYLTSIADENAFYSSGATAAFGIRLQTDTAARRVFVADAYEGAPALAAGIDRGAEILAIGADAGSLKTVDGILAAGGSAGLSDAFGPANAGVTRSLQIRDAAGTRTLTVAKADFSIQPISPRFGTRIITDGGQKIGYINLRSFITPADPALRTAFASFRAQGVTQLIFDVRYNGGGLVSIAELIGDLLGDNRLASDVFSYTSFRPEKSANDTTRLFRTQAESIRPLRIAFIGTAGTASASELVINAFTPYLGPAAALIGANTYGKPVGQVALDRAACDDRLRVIAFATQNAARQGNYFSGLASTVGASCRADDTLAQPMGDPAEASTAVALDFLAGRSCTPISTDAKALSVAAVAAQRTLLMPDRPSVVQREVPGSY